MVAVVTRERVFVLEVTGPTLPFLQERKEHLPHLGRLMEQGARGRLRGPLQPVAPTSFATLWTGKNPGKTGLFDFFLFPRGGYELVPYDLGKLRAEPLFETLSRAGRRVGILNAPLTHPLPDVDGFVVSGDEGIGEDFACPEPVRDRLVEMNYEVPFGASYAPGRELDFYEHAVELWERRVEAFRTLFGEREWDFGWYTVHLYGELLHAFWRFYDPAHPAYRPREEVFGGADPFLHLLTRIDDLLGEVIELVGSRGLVLFLGAWGHRLEHSRVDLNAFLEREGYLRFRRRPVVAAKRLLARSGLSLTAAERLAHRLNLWKLFHYGLPRGRRAAIKSAAFLSFEDVDWSRTRAVASGYSGQVYLNTRDARPSGVIGPEEYPEERARLRRLLEELRDPRTGKAIVRRVHPREEIYRGPELPSAPDLVVELAEGWATPSGLTGARRVVGDSPENHSSEHWNESAFLAWGEGVRSGDIDVRLEDVAPTILSKLGVEPPHGCDGRALGLSAVRP